MHRVRRETVRTVNDLGESKWQETEENYIMMNFMCSVRQVLTF
jgi:hypothetical protein